MNTTRGISEIFFSVKNERARTVKTLFAWVLATGLTAVFAQAAAPWGLDLPTSWNLKVLSNGSTEITDPRGELRVEFILFNPSPWPNHLRATEFLKDRFSLASNHGNAPWYFARGESGAYRCLLLLHNTTNQAILAVARIRGDAPLSCDAAVESLYDSFDPSAEPLSVGPGIMGTLVGGASATRPPLEIRFGGELLRADFTPWERQVGRLAAAREKTTLDYYGMGDATNRTAARQRYYRRLYRHFWPALEPLGGSLIGYFNQRHMGEAAQVAFLTAGVYLIPTATGVTGPLESPLDLLLGESGRPDAKTLLLTLLLHRTGLDGDFLLSLTERHAFIGLPRRYLAEPQNTFLTRADKTPLVGIELITVPNTVFRFPNQWAIVPLRF